VTWLSRAEDKVRRDLVARFSRELRLVFADARAIAVAECLDGYSRNHDERVVLGVDVRTAASHHTHVVKLGTVRAVGRDFDGFLRCLQRRSVASRVFVRLRRRPLPQGRVAVIYEDAARFFGPAEEGLGPRTLEYAVSRAVLDGAPDPVSVERVIRQIYTDLHRWFYRGARANRQRALRFYRARLRRAAERWTAEPWRRDMRRDLLWLLCSQDPADGSRSPVYLDPCDYVGWALREGRLPPTFTGRAHGDLHGRNILVGIQRGEAEYPAVFDYGEMSARNVLAWDFVKLETELKVRLLEPLYEDPACRATLHQLGPHYGLRPEFCQPDRRPSAETDAGAARACRLAFAFVFETVLAELTRRIGRLANADSPEPPGGRTITGNIRMDRALAVLLRVRQEAALFLGELQPQRGDRHAWRDEYGFALAAYGVSTAKYAPYREIEAGFALVSAGVAAAQMEAARADVARQVARRAGGRTGRPARTYPYPSYHVPLAHVHRLWKSGRIAGGTRKALALLEGTLVHYGHAVPLAQEYALLLAQSGRHEQALRLLGPLDDLCRVFCDAETLSRIGRTCKDLGDRALLANPVSPARLPAHPASHWYGAALTHYRKAFEVSRGYYPGINTATLALLCGRRQEARATARDVWRICRRQDLSTLSPEERFWLLGSQAEAALLLGNTRQARIFYRQALSLGEAAPGMVQSTYDQVSRLAWVIGRTARSMLAVFEPARRRLRPGPFDRLARRGSSRLPPSVAPRAAS
jgi:tetratricopeptide (TPR) repeat protein